MSEQIKHQDIFYYDSKTVFIDGEEVQIPFIRNTREWVELHAAHFETAERYIHGGDPQKNVFRAIPLPERIAFASGQEIMVLSEGSYMLHTGDVIGKHQFNILFNKM